MQTAKWSLKGNYYGGQYHPCEADELNDWPTLSKFSPADDSFLWKTNLPGGCKDYILKSANDGFQTWRKTNFEERKQRLLSYKEIVAARSEEIAEAIALETGKPLWESKTEAAALAGKVETTLGDSYERIQAKNFREIFPNTAGEVLYKPLGVVLVIGPYNFPCHLPNTQILAALLSGNSVIFKPSEKTFYSAQLMADCFIEAGLPPGVFQFYLADADLTADIVKDERVNAIHFTGSLEVGKKILASTHQQVSKLVALELGGRNTSIVLEDAHLATALPELIKACFLSTGQRCTSTTTIAVARSIFDDFRKQFIELAEQIWVDHPIDFEKLPFMGPLIDSQAKQKFQRQVLEMKAEGFEENFAPRLRDGLSPVHYQAPVVLTWDQDQKELSALLQNEVFGPLAVLCPIDSLEDGIEIANCSPYGLSAAVFSQDENNFALCQRDIQAGIINFNRSTVGASPKLPFGGHKNSGNHRPAAVAMIDSCVSVSSCLKMEISNGQENVPIPEVPGLYPNKESIST